VQPGAEGNQTFVICSRAIACLPPGE